MGGAAVCTQSSGRHGCLRGARCRAQGRCSWRHRAVYGCRLRRRVSRTPPHRRVAQLTRLAPSRTAPTASFCAASGRIAASWARIAAGRYLARCCGSAGACAALPTRGLAQAGSLGGAHAASARARAPHLRHGCAGRCERAMSGCFRVCPAVVRRCVRLQRAARSAAYASTPATRAHGVLICVPPRSTRLSGCARSARPRGPTPRRRAHARSDCRALSRWQRAFT